jgi:hypothetical protein
MSLNVKAVLQPQGAEFVLLEIAGEKASGLVAKLGDPLIDEALIDGVVLIHAQPPEKCPAG